MPNETLPLTGASWTFAADAAERARAVHWAYRIMLLREPESREAVDYLVRTASTARQLRDTLLGSAEMRASPGFPVVMSMSGDEPPQAVQTEVDPAQRRQLFARVQQVWHSLGEQQPHWSVVTADEFRPDRIGESLEHFYATGEGNIQTLLRMLRRNGVEPASLSSCLDFGCGVGRLTFALCKQFRQVVGVDVSASHLAVARSEAAKRGISNVDFRLLATVEAIDELPQVDLVYSIIVLQHNPPPVIRALFAGLLRRLSPGGVAVVQVPTYLPGGYSFEARSYLATPAGEMEMHALPQREAFALAREAGVNVLEVLEDMWTGYGAGSRSNTFVMQRPRGSAR